MPVTLFGFLGLTSWVAVRSLHKITLVLRERSGFILAPKEQPPRKLSGIKDRKTFDALERGRVSAHRRGQGLASRRENGLNLSGSATEGARIGVRSAPTIWGASA